ncbi:MAG: FGGY-family carbohydrate kinase [Proteobacteria bacterium]|nr:FGGY-family carbohydrate kinase [Pseudomonadota bacterium]
MPAANDKYVLVIDLGTSGSKTALASIYGEIIDFDFEEVPVHHLKNGGVEQDPHDWWKAIMTTSKRLLDKELVPRESIVAICASTQWSGTVPVDKDGQPLMNAIIWMDSRGEKQVNEAAGGLINLEGYDVRKLYNWIRITGGAPALTGKDPVGHILYVKDQLPEIYKKTYKFLEPKDFVNLCFTGKFAASYDSITLHWVTDNRNLTKIDYHKKLLKYANLEREKLPDLKQSIDILGPVKKEIADELGLRGDVPVIMGTPDLQAAALGSGAVDDYVGHIYIGTSSWLNAHVPFKKTDIFHSIASLPCPIPNRYLVSNEQEAAGACLTFLRDNILYHKDELLKEESVPDVYKIFDRIADKIPAGANKVLFTPWLNGERTPVENNTIRSGLHNLSLSSTRGDIIRAVLEGVAYNLKWVLFYVEKFIKRQMESIHFVGGGANSKVWCQIIADVLNKEIKQVKDPIQANARGAAFLAGVALNYLSFGDVAKCIQIDEVFKPRAENRKIYDEMYKEYLNIYKNNQKMYERLNRN